jgi:spore coat protein U-like protein
VSIGQLRQTTVIAIGFALSVFTSAAAAVHTQIMHQRGLSPVVRQANTESHRDCLLFEVTDMQFPAASSVTPRTLTVSATVRLINGCTTTTGMSIILSDNSGSNGFAMHANHVTLPLRLFVGTDATGVEASNGKSIKIAQLNAQTPELHLFGEVQTNGSVVPGTYSDNISATLMNTP